MTPFGAPELVPDWQDSHALSAYVPPSCLGHWIRTDLGVRTFQGLGKNAPLREQVVRRLARDAHTHQILESLPCDIHLQVPLHRRCLPGCGPQTSAARDIQTTLVYRLRPSLSVLRDTTKELSPAPFPLVPFAVPSENSTIWDPDLDGNAKFLDEAELRSHQEMSRSQKAVTKEGNTEGKEEYSEGKEEHSVEDGHLQTEVEKEVIRAFRTLLQGCEEQWCYAAQQDSPSSGSEAEEAQCQLTPSVTMARLSLEEAWKMEFQKGNRSSIYAMTGFNLLWLHGSLEP